MTMTGEELRDEGMARAAGANSFLLDETRKIAIGIAEGRDDRQCSAADLIAPIAARGFERGNWLGSVFRGWEFTGEWEKNPVPSRHSGFVRIWYLPPGEVVS